MGWWTPATGVTPGMRRPVRTITLPSIASRRIRLGLPTSSAPSGVIVAAFRPRPVSLIRFAASVHTAFSVARRFSSERSKRSTSSSSRSTFVSSTRSDCSSSSCPVSSPSSATMLIGSHAAATLSHGSPLWLSVVTGAAPRRGRRRLPRLRAGGERAARRSAGWSTSSPGASTARTGRPVSSPSRRPSTRARLSCSACGAPLATFTFSLSAIAASIGSGTVFALSITWSSGRSPAGAGNNRIDREPLEQRRDLLGLLDLRGVARALDQLGSDAGDVREALDRLLRVEDLVLGAEDHHERAPAPA